MRAFSVQRVADVRTIASDPGQMPCVQMTVANCSAAAICASGPGARNAASTWLLSNTLPRNASASLSDRSMTSTIAAIRPRNCCNISRVTNGGSPSRIDNAGAFGPRSPIHRKITGPPIRAHNRFIRWTQTRLQFCTDQFKTAGRNHLQFAQHVSDKMELGKINFRIHLFQHRRLADYPVIPAGMQCEKPVLQGMGPGYLYHGHLRPSTDIQNLWIGQHRIRPDMRRTKIDAWLAQYLLQQRRVWLGDKFAKRLAPAQRRDIVSGYPSLWTPENQSRLAILAICVIKRLCTAAQTGHKTPRSFTVSSTQDGD